jgi:phage internal scaffolding protein
MSSRTAEAKPTTRSPESTDEKRYVSKDGARFQTPYRRFAFPSPATDERSMTKQAEADDCDINKIVERHRLVGRPPDERPRLYGDFSSVPDFMAAQNTLARAKEQFASLPAKLRDRFENRPEAFLEYAADPDNEKEMRKLGLLAPEAPRASQAPETPAKKDVPDPKPAKTPAKPVKNSTEPSGSDE